MRLQEASVCASDDELIPAFRSFELQPHEPNLQWQKWLRG